MSGSPAVLVDKLTVKFGDFTAVDSVSFAVDRGEVFGFLGANGAGKTTTIRVLCGLLEPTSGTVRVAGIGFEHGPQAIKSRIGYMSQKFTLYNDLSVDENLAFAGSLRKMELRTLRARKAELLEWIGFSGALKAKVQDLPGGIKQQVSLVAAILHDPEVIFLDEPTAGVTPAARARFWQLINQLANEGKTVFVTTHYMDEAEQCGRVALMRTGKIEALGSPEALKAEIYPDALYEISVAKEEEKSILSEIRKSELVAELQPYGLRYHAVAKRADAWEKFAKQNGIKTIRIKPSLEDVFIRVVEGRSE
jgi:ABC-2 type transport system ATP-binding protein